MSRLSKALATAVAVGLAVPVWAGPASAETVTETAAVGAYYLFSNPGVIGNDPNNPLGGQKAPDNAKNADGVAQDDLAVAVNVPGQTDKFSALQWTLLDLTLEATVASAKVTLPFSTKPESNRNDRKPDLVVACLAGPEGFGDADGEPFQDAPNREACTPELSIKGTPVEGGTAVEFDITPIAQQWTEMNVGMLLVPSPEGKNQPFQNVFADKSQARLALSFTAPAPEVFDDPELSATGDSFDSSTGSTGTFDSGTFDSGTFDSGSSDFSIGSGSGSGSGSVGLDSGGAAFDAGGLDAPVAGADGDSPTVAGDEPVLASGGLAKAASSSGNPMALDVITWLALLGGAALLAVVSLALGAPAMPGAARQAVRPGGVASALARRQSAGAFGARSL